MGRRRIEVPPVLLGVLAVVPFGPVEAEDPFLQDGVAPVPEGEGEAEDLGLVADPGEAVLVPAVGAGSSMVVREVLPGVVLVFAVVLADGAPGPLGQVGPPSFPVAPVGLEALALGIGHGRTVRVGPGALHRPGGRRFRLPVCGQWGYSSTNGGATWVKGGAQSPKGAYTVEAD